MNALETGDFLAWEVSGLRALGRLLWQENAESLSRLPIGKAEDALSPYGICLADVDHAVDHNQQWVQEELALGVELARLEAGDVDIFLGSVRHAAEGALEAGERL